MQVHIDWIDKAPVHRLAGAVSLTVREAILEGTASRWTEVTQWYWESLFGQTRGPWWAITVAEHTK